jgi:hypothetical protein
MKRLSPSGNAPGRQRAGGWLQCKLAKLEEELWTVLNKLSHVHVIGDR